MNISRRKLLSALGLTAAAGALPRYGVGSARADDSVPKRLIILSSSHGSVHEHWSMNPWGLPDAQPWEGDLTALSSGAFSRVLQPLHACRDRLLVMDGLSMVSAEVDIPGYRHEKGWIHAWTGADVHFTGSDLFSTQASLDQLVARQIARPDRLPSLELAIAEGRPVCHGGHSQQLPLEDEPQRVWDRLFGLSTSTNPLVAAQGSVLDFALAEHAALSSRLPSSDRARLDAHFELVRQLEQRIEGLSQAACDGVDAGALASTTSGYDQLFTTMSELIGAAFACDLTRVATISLGDLPSERFGWGDYLSGDAHNDFAHRIYEDPRAAEAMGDYNRHHAQQLAELVALLESIPEGEGSMMDYTLIVWGNELADGWHGYERYPALTVGGDWAFTPGRYLRWPYGTTPVPLVGPQGMIPAAGLPHQHLLVSVARAMGLEVESVGQDELRTAAGEVIDLTGELLEMY